MTTLADLLTAKQKLLERLHENRRPHERDQIDGLVVQIDAALAELMKNSARRRGVHVETKRVGPICNIDSEI
jgi:hypothetical protein